MIDISLYLIEFTCGDISSGSFDFGLHIPRSLKFTPRILQRSAGRACENFDMSYMICNYYYGSFRCCCFVVVVLVAALGLACSG